MLNELDEPTFVEVVEKSSNVGVQYVVHLLLQERVRQRIQRLMLAAPPGETRSGVALVPGAGHPSPAERPRAVGRRDAGWQPPSPGRAPLRPRPDCAPSAVAAFSKTVPARPRCARGPRARPPARRRRVVRLAACCNAAARRPTPCARSLPD